MLLQLSHFPPFTPLHPAHPLTPTFLPLYSSCPWVIHISSLASTFPISFLLSPCLFSTYHLCHLFSVPFPPLSPSHSPVDNPPCDLHFFFLDIFIDYAITVVPFLPLHSTPSCPPPHSHIPPLQFMSMGHTYKFFGFHISYTILTLPLYIFHLSFMLFILCTFPPSLPLPSPY